MPIRSNIRATVSCLAPVVCGALPQMAAAQSVIEGYAQRFVTTCTTAILGEGDHATRLKQAGFTSRHIKLAKGAFVNAPKKDGGLCFMSFGSVFPNPHLMMNAINVELARAGFKDTGKELRIASKGNIFAGTGAKTRHVYTKGGQNITLEIAGGQNVSPIIAFKSLPN